MTLRHRHHDGETELDSRIKASRTSYIADHDASFDFEAGWADISARAGRAAQGDRQRELSDESLPTVVDPGRPGRRQGRRKVLVGVASIAAATALIAGILVAGSNGDSETNLAMKIIAATESALGDSIEHEVTDWANTPVQPDDEAWRDQTSAHVRFLHYAEDGSGRSLDMGPVTAPTVDHDGPMDPSLGPILERAVDYCFREYVVDALPIPPEATNINSSLARAVIEGLANGSMRTDGTEVIDGQELIRVIEEEAPDSTWYIDPETYRPVRLVGGEGGDEDFGTYTTTIEYLPRTAESLAQFSPVVPDGFVQVDQLSRTDDYIPGCS